MKVGIVCEGGAYRTIFTSGVLDAFLQQGIACDYFIGVSAGIAYGISFPSGQPGRNLKILETYGSDPRYLSVRNLVNPRNRCLYGVQFAFYDVPNRYIPLDFEALARYEGQLVAVVTNVETGEAEHLPVPKDARALDLMVATCAMPLLFPVVEYEGKKYMDGGIADPIPFQAALDAGCDKLLVILTRERSYVKGRERATEFSSLFYRKYPRFVHALGARSHVYNRSRERLLELESEGKALLLFPEDTAGFSRTEKDPEKLRALYRQGLDAATREMPRIKAYLDVDQT